jgi:hypothetical protein
MTKKVHLAPKQSVQVIRVADAPLTYTLRERIVRPISPTGFEVVHNDLSTRIEVQHYLYSQKGRLVPEGPVKTVFVFDALFQARKFMKWAFDRDLTSFTVDCYDGIETKRLLARKRRFARKPSRRKSTRKS